MKNILIIGNSHIGPLFKAWRLCKFEDIDLNPIFLDVTHGKILPLDDSKTRLEDKI